MDVIRLATALDRLEFDPNSGQLISFRRKSVPDQEFILHQLNDPVFLIQYLDENKRYRQLASTQAENIQIRLEKNTLLMAFERLKGMAVDVTVAVHASPEEDASRWSIALHNDCEILVTGVQFPFVVLPYTLGGAPGSEELVQPLGSGALLKSPRPQDIAPDDPHTWQLTPANGDIFHYPGITFAQFLAYYNNRAGIYLSSQDSEGHIKLIKPTHRRKGLRLGFCHIGDWQTQTNRKLEYEMVLRSFTGNWYDAAAIYRDWALQQPWTRTPLHQRKDVPAWLLDSPPHIICRIQGELDAGPAEPNPQFLPYPKMIPLLEQVSSAIDSPLVPVIMSWERPGPWIYPDCFPPAGGSESLKEFCALARQRSWHIGTFCNGTRWATAHRWTGYDGQDYFIEQDGENCICRTPTGTPWKEMWDEAWRPSYPCCLAVDQTRQIASNFVQTIIDLGLDWIQFLDQNCGCVTFPCFAGEEHGHPTVPGKWMTDSMHLLIDEFHRLGGEENQRSGGERQFAFSVEMAINEIYLQEFQICDIRVLPPGHTFPGLENFIPLYHFLYHEFILSQGGFGSAPEPYHMPIRNAYNWVVGEIPGGVLTGDGSLLNKDTTNWAPWENPVGSNADSLRMLRVTTALRRGTGKDFLVYGRMEKPAVIEGIKTMRWQENGKDHQIPAVFHSAWTSPNGRFALALANWTNEAQDIELEDPRLGDAVTQIIAAEDPETRTRRAPSGRLTVTLPALSCALVIQQR